MAGNSHGCRNIVASTTLVSLGQGVDIAGYGFIYPMIFAFLLNVFAALTFAELSGMIPRAGSVNHYTLPAMGPFMGMIAIISGYLIVSIFGTSRSARGCRLDSCCCSA